MPEMTLKIELSDDAKRLLHYMSSAKDENVECGEVWHLGKWKGLQPFPMPERPSVGRNATPVGEGKNFPGNGKAPKEKDLIDCVDCQVFAREFHRRYPSIDEGSLLGWFATAIENGKSAGRREAAAKEPKSSDYAADTAGYHASAPTNIDGKSEAIGDPMSFHQYRVGDFVWSHRLKTVGIVTKVLECRMRLDEDSEAVHWPPDLHPVSMACYDEFRRMRASIREHQNAIANDKSSGQRDEAKNATKVPEGFIDGGTVLHLGTGRAMMVVGVEDLGRVVACDGPEKITDWMINFQSIPRETYDLMRKSRSAARELGEALGLLTTLAPKMVIDPDHPIKMAQEIVRVVKDERKEYRTAREAIEVEIPEEFRGPQLKESVRLLACALRGLRILFNSTTNTAKG